MSTWVIISWIFVAVLTGVNVFIFLKLKKTSDQMMKMAFPGAKNMNEGLAQMQSQMQKMMGGSQGMRGRDGSPQMQAQLKSAMDMLNQMNQGGRR